MGHCRANAEMAFWVDGIYIVDILEGFGKYAGIVV
jgi:hypothetical protein